MAEDGKAAGQPQDMTQPAKDDGKDARRRAPDQDVLPGILGKQLKAAYSELLNAPIPDEFTDLIKRLESKEPIERSEKPGREESGE
jgi:hypothetical protein